MYVYDFFRPITYDTDVLSVLHCYNNGILPLANPFVNFETPNFTYNNPYCGSCFSPEYNFQSSNPKVNSELTYQNFSFGDSIYNFSGNSYPSNSSLEYIDNSYYNGKIYNFTGKSPVNTKIKSSQNLSVQSSAVASSAKAEPSYATNTTKKDTSIGKSFASNAAKYLGYSEKNGESKVFSNSSEWCADFVTYVVKETYKEKGLDIPAGFGNHRVENLRQWGIQNNKYLSLTNKSDKASTIANNVKIGDILILREDGASHTGIVTKINSNGSFETIEGNVASNGDDKVVKRSYSADYKKISGFVQLS
jgi:hypothetical protein